MSKYADIAVANCGVGDKGQPEAVFVVNEGVAIDRHTRFCDFEGEREEGVAHDIEAKHQLNRILYEDTPKGKELIDRVYSINSLDAPRPRPDEASVHKHLHKDMKDVLDQSQENKHVVNLQWYTVVIIIVVIV